MERCNEEKHGYFVKEYQDRMRILICTGVLRSEISSTNLATIQNFEHRIQHIYINQEYIHDRKPITKKQQKKKRKEYGTEREDAPDQRVAAFLQP